MSASAPSGERRISVVVMLDSISRPGGGERLAIEGIVRLDRARFDRTLCLTRWDDDFEVREPARSMLARARAAGVAVIGLRRSHRLALWAWIPLLRAIRRQRVDVLHGHLFGSNVWATVIGRLSRVPAVVAHEHMWAYSGNRLRPFIDRELIARFSDAFVAVSEEGRRRMMADERIPADDIVLIPNGIAALPAGDGARARAALNVPASAPLLLSVGHLRAEKAFWVLIEAVARLREHHPDVRAVIAGEGPERGRLEELRDRLGLHDRVLLPGSRDDVPDLLAAADVGVCCSDFEGGPLSVMEYMGAGLPVVASRVGGLPELVLDGESGRLVPRRDPEALSAAVDALLADPARAAQMGAAGRERRRRDHDVDRWVARLEELYLRLLQAAPGR